MVTHVYVNQLFSRQTDTLPGSIAIACMCLRLSKEGNPHVLQPFVFFRLIVRCGLKIGRNGE
jgi:hypothetical protein